jgi:hypothetical protein
MNLPISELDCSLRLEFGVSVLGEVPDADRARH